MDKQRLLLFTFGGPLDTSPWWSAAASSCSRVILLVIGPIDWNLDHAVQVYAFLVAASAALVGGYVWAIKSRRFAPSDPDPNDGGPTRARGLAGLSATRSSSSDRSSTSSSTCRPFTR